MTGSLSRRTVLRLGAGGALSTGLVPFLSALPAHAQRSDTIVVVIGQTINSLDIHRTGTNRPSYQVPVNCYDRLVSFGLKEMPDGSLSYDYSKIVPELAESWEISDDRSEMRFKIKPNAIFQDGSKVTAHDVKWSFDRAVSAGGFPTVQMKAGNLSSPDQFTAEDDETFVITFDVPSKLSLPDLAVPVPFILNSTLAKKHATADDPWAMEYVHKHTIGSGAFKVVRWDPGQQLVYERFDGWVGGALPPVKRVIVREVPSQATRRALIERGDVQVSLNVPNKDAAELKSDPKLQVYSTPIENAIYSVALNRNFAPFQDDKVRKAFAYAIPYEEIFKTAAYGIGVPMFGGPEKVSDAVWPQPSPYSTDLDKAKALLAESGFADGFEVPFYISLGQLDWMEPAALLIIENLAKLGIKSTLEKVPGANWRTQQLVEKKLPLSLASFGGWLNYPDYYFYWAFKDGHLFNASNYRSEEMEKLVDDTLFIPIDDPAYAPNVKRMAELAFEDLPRIQLWQPALNTVVHGADGYQYWFHRTLDARGLSRTEA